MDLDKIQTIVTRYCQQEENIVAVYLFGSRATGCNRVGSDVDLALLLREDDATSFDLLGFIVTMQDLLALPVDAIILNRAGEVLKCQVRKRNVVIFDRDEKFRKLFEVRSRKYFEDFLYIHKRYTRKVLFGG